MMMFFRQPKSQMKLSKKHRCSHGEITWKKGRQIEDKLKEEKVEENFKNLASVLKHIPDWKNK